MPPPFTDAELLRLDRRDQQVLRMRYGLVDEGRAFTHLEIGNAVGVSRSRIQPVLRKSLRTIQNSRSVKDAYAAGMRMGEVERSRPPVPSPFDPGGAARSRLGIYRPVRSEELSDEGLLIIGTCWRAMAQRWGLLLSCKPPITIAAVLRIDTRGSHHFGPRCILLADRVSPGMPVRAWLERLRIEHQKDPQSLPFLIGAIHVMLVDGSGFWSAELVESAVDPALSRKWGRDERIARAGSGGTR